jgi:hypothetical protein
VFLCIFLQQSPANDDSDVRLVAVEGHENAEVAGGASPKYCDEGADGNVPNIELSLVPATMVAPHDEVCSIFAN